jgi:hypothetical protein
MSVILPLVSWVLLKKGENMLRYSNDPRDPAMLSTTRSSTGNVVTSSKITPMSAVTNLSAVRIVTMSSPVWHAPEQQLTIQEEQEEEGEEAEEAPAV